MKKLDSFFDTYEKRTLFIYLIYLFCMILFALMHVILGFHLIGVHTYEQTLSLVNETSLQNAFFGRCALGLLNMPVFDLMNYLIQMILSLHGYEIIFLIGNILFIFTKRKKNALYALSCIVIPLLILIMIFLMAFQAGTFAGAIAYIRIMGFLFMIIFIPLLIVEIIQFYKCFIEYQKALKIEVIIIE